MKLNKTLIGIIAAVVIIGAWAALSYNSMVSVQEEATTALANVQSTYQRRADLIPNLVEVVKGYAAHEEFQQAQGELGAALGRLIAIQENYPDLKANENFRDLQVQLEGTENRINEARNTYNGVVQQYNIVIRKFPKNLLAGMFGFNTMDKFEAEAGAEKAPQVKF